MERVTPNHTNAMLRSFLHFALVAAPTALAMWLLFTLEQRAVWAPETPYRDLITALLLASAMAASFVVFTVLRRKNR
ncbi:MAG: hypothetical protein AAGI11_19770 [Pseudomonadota bacterium]